MQFYYMLSIQGGSGSNFGDGEGGISNMPNPHPTYMVNDTGYHTYLIFEAMGCIVYM